MRKKVVSRQSSVVRYAPIASSAMLFCILHFAFCIQPASAQGLHFSQFYSAPMLVSPANTGLMSDKDYRVGANYRTQWGALPVPYSSFSVYGDIQVFRRKLQTSWLGIGGSLFTDKSGDGNLALTRWEASAAYHLELGEVQMLSVGLSAASVQRRVDLTKLVFDAQWDGYAFDRTLPNGERTAIGNTGYGDYSAGLNYAYFPTELIYMKVGVGLAHINKPTESFYGGSNHVDMRPTGYLDVLARVGDRVVVNPAGYFTAQGGASEFLYGSLITILFGQDNVDGSLILGGYHRFNDAVIGVAGYEWNGLRFLASFDYTISELGQYNNHHGALEFGIRYQNSYYSGRGRSIRDMNCPRF